jgi:hypothetical protein
VEPSRFGLYQKSQTLVSSREGVGQPARDGIQFGVDFFHTYPGTQAAQQVECSVSPVLEVVVAGPSIRGEPNLRGIPSVESLKPPRSDAEDDGVDAIENSSPPNHAWVTPKASLPQAMADDYWWRFLAAPIFPSHKRSAQRRVDP